ncbi:hypothetical protein J1614_005087 [Plenodomus biglobosus]|nr:hypothetical protein J1614_005087 [Plenodomus biglobosus]
MADEDKIERAESGGERDGRDGSGAKDGSGTQDESGPESDWQDESDVPNESKTQPESTTQPESDVQHESNTQSENDTQYESNSQPENNAHSESTTQPESTAQPATFHIRKKSSEEVKLQAATPTPSALTPGLKAHPTQTHMGPAHCAGHMFDTPENIDDGWKRDSFVKPEAETPMGSMTVKHIESDTILYNCGTCGTVP